MISGSYPIVRLGAQVDDLNMKESPQTMTAASLDAMAVWVGLAALIAAVASSVCVNDQFAATLLSAVSN